MVEPALTRVGTDLQRPECVLACASGRLYASDRRGGVMSIAPDGTERLIGRSNLTPNGIALRRDGSFVIANLAEEGGVWTISAEGDVRPLLHEIEGIVLPRVNFVALDAHERLWICVSALETGDRYPVRDRTGFIALMDARGVRIVADGMQYTNECRIDATGRHVFVNETFGRRVTRFDLAADGALSNRQVFAELFRGDFPDGLTPDAEGGWWVMCVGSNRVYRVNAGGTVEVVIDDSDPATVDALEAAFRSDTLTRSQLGASTGKRLAAVTSLAFGGPDLRTAYLGCLKGTALASFRSPYPGLRPVHWDWS
jgi:sugar lactone lactonase YvrE